MAKVSKEVQRRDTAQACKRSKHLQGREELVALGHGAAAGAGHEEAPLGWQQPHRRRIQCPVPALPN